LLEIRQSVDTLRKIETEMADLCKASRDAAPSVGAYLTVHRKLSTGLVALRWRKRGGDKCHLVIDAVREMVVGQDAAVGNWVESAAERAEALNANHARERVVLKLLQDKRRKRPAVPLLPRAIR
jgi:hypothetical protein